MKCTGCILVIACSFLLGLYYENRLERRLFGLKQIYLCMQLLKGEIGYQHATLAEAFSHLSTRCGRELEHWLLFLGEELKKRNAVQFVDVWQASLCLLSESTELSKGDISLLREFGRNLGYLNLELQEARIAFFMEELAGVTGELSDMLIQRKKLYRTVGFLGGVFLALLLI